MPPLSILAGAGVARILARRDRRPALVLGAVAIATVVVTVPVWFDGPAAQAKAIWPDEPHLRHDSALVRYVDAHTKPGQKLLVLWAAADVYYLADRAPAIPYMWRRNIEAIPGVLERRGRRLQHDSRRSSPSSSPPESSTRADGRPRSWRRSTVGSPSSTARRCTCPDGRRERSAPWTG